MTAPQKRLIDCIVGARPNFVKIAPVMRALATRDDLSARLIHTGQHYDVSMNDVFFEELGIPRPDINLDISSGAGGSGTGTEQTARIMLGLEPVFLARRPALLLLVGDVNSTVAAAMVAAKLLIPIAHIEAGLRSFDRTMPEEINRLVTDRLSDLLFVTEPAGIDNLVREGIDPRRIVFVGNVMIDTLLACLERATSARDTLASIDAPAGTVADALQQGFGFVTLHRPSNVDDPQALAAILKTLAIVSRKLPLVFAVHPRTRATIERAGLGQILADARIIVVPPVGYLKAIGLMREAKLVITDSGGVQEETTALGVPCLTVRENTERPVTIEKGTNTLVGTSPEALLAGVDDVLTTGGKRGRIPALWDGKAAERIVEEIGDYFSRA